MRIVAVADRSFEQGSPVCAYWLAHCERFDVRAGRRTGTVERVELDESQRPKSLAIRFGFRRRVVPADQVHAVVPARRLIVVEPPRGPRPSPSLGPIVASTRTTSRRAASAGYHGGRTAAAATGRGAVAAAGWAAVALALVAQLAHAYARAAAIAVTRTSAAAVAAAEAALAERRARRAQKSEEPTPPRRRRSQRRMQAR